MSAEIPLSDLRAQSEHAKLRLALYRRRVYLGRGNLDQLHEYERIADGARERLHRAEARTPRRTT